ncbi:MAG TPA: O-antigen ligase family protein, partial [Bacteroidota bacterium]|nr:O-antigen ligase family protein [Bacteroidota bacterium]
MTPNDSQENAGDILPRRTIYCFLVVTLVGLTFSIAVSSIAMGVAIGLLLFLILKNGWSGVLRTPLDLFFLAYVLAEILSTIFSVEPISSLVNMKRLLLISIVYLVLLSIDDEVKLKFLLGLLIFVPTLLTVLELFALTSIGGHYVRMSLFQYYLTEAGIKMIMLLLTLPFVIHAETPIRWKVAAGVASGILFLGLVITQTRSAWLGFIGGVITLGMLRNKKLLAALLLIIILFVFFAPSDFRVRAASIFDPTLTSNLTRIHMITTGWRMFLDRPLLGTG